MTQKNKISTPAVAAGAAIAGAAIGAAAVALSDKKNREKVVKVAEKMKKHAEKAVHTMGEDVKDASKEGEKKASEVVETISNRVQN